VTKYQTYFAAAVVLAILALICRHLWRRRRQRGERSQARE
jgi:hypothetical protein